MTNAKRNRAFKLARAEQLRELVKLHRAAAGDVSTLMGEALSRITQQLGTAGLSDFQAWQLPQIRKSIEQSLAEINAGLGSSAGEGAAKAWSAGVDMVDRPLEAGGIRISAVLPEVDTRQLLAMRTFMLDRIQDLTANVARQAANEIGLVVLGTQTPSQAVDAIAARIEGGRGRAITIVRTEMGRAFSVAGHERKHDAAAVLPGLRKQWRRSGKVHSRESHDLADGQIVEVDKPFIVGGVELMYPRDPAAPASETINCGCVSLPYMESWTVSQPGRQPFTDQELAGNRKKRDLAAALAD